MGERKWKFVVSKKAGRPSFNTLFLPEPDHPPNTATKRESSVRRVLLREDMSHPRITLSDESQALHWP